MGLQGWPKTSGSRGMHVNARIEPRWTFIEVRRAALALSRAVERRGPAPATLEWGEGGGDGGVLGYHQKAKERTPRPAHSRRPLSRTRGTAPPHFGAGSQ